MLTFSSVMIGTLNLEVMAKFYEQLFQKPADMVEGDWHGWASGGAFLSVGKHSEMQGMAKDPARVMFNFETKEVKEEYDRLIKAGAKSVKEPYEMSGAWIATLADPDGNYFQLMTPWES